MTLDEAIEERQKVIKAQEKLYEETSTNESKEIIKSAIDNDRQLAEWLTDYKELKNSIGAVKLNNMKEALELMREYKAENIAQKKMIAEYKRLLKAAVEDVNFSSICLNRDACKACAKRYNISCEKKFKWRYADEALTLIGDEPNGI